MTPIERAARAMYDTVQPEWDWDDPDAGPMRRLYRENARAAILAIREPSPAMLAVSPVTRQHWRRMIDVVLEVSE